MRIQVGIMIGQPGQQGFYLTKEVELPHSPIVGMELHDVEMWKHPHKIINVDLPQDEDDPDIYVTVEPDPAGNLKQYQEAGWTL